MRESAATSTVWRHLTHPGGMTVSLLVTATGLSAEQVRAELRALEQSGRHAASARLSERSICGGARRTGRCAT